MEAGGTYTDNRLFSLISEGDEAAFEQVFHQYVGWIGRIIFRIVKSETVTQDLVQEVFLHLWLGRDKLADVNDPALWLYRIAYNRSYLYLRGQQIHEKATAAIRMEHPLPDLSNDTELQLHLKETSRLIQEAIGQLPRQSRRIYQLNRVEGLRPAAIAEELGISVQSVRNSLTRSAKLIRGHLAQHGVNIPLLLLLLPLPEIFL